MSSSEEASNALPPMDHDELDESHQEEEENDDDAVVTAAVATVQHGEGILDEKEADTNKESMSANTASNRTETPSEVYLIRNSQRDNRRLPEVTAHNKRVPIQTTTRIRRVGTTDGRHDKALASLSDDALAMARVVQSKHGTLIVDRGLYLAYTHLRGEWARSSKHIRVYYSFRSPLSSHERVC
jgi:hypothetical protein